MLNRHSFFFRFALLLIVITFLALMLMYLTSANLFSSMMVTADRDEVYRNLEAGEQLLLDYDQGKLTLDDLHEAVNPVFGSGQNFLLLLDIHGRTLARTDSAFNVLSLINLPSLMQTLDRQGTGHPLVINDHKAAFITASVTPVGYALAGQMTNESNEILYTYQARLLIFLSVILILFMFISLFSTKRMVKPALVLTQAAEKLSEGQVVHISEEYYGEIREIAQAFNTMSDKVSSAIRAMKHEKETVTLILEGLQEGILAVDDTGVLIHENQSAKDILREAGESAEQDLKSKLAALQTDSPAPQALSGTFMAGDRVILYILSVIPRSDGYYAGAVALLRDITEQERLENTRREYVANISHELRTPLSSIRGIAEGLQDGLVTDEKELHRFYTIIAEESNRLSRLVNDLLELSGLQTRQEAFEMEEVDPREVILDLHDRNRQLFDNAGIAFHCRMPEETPLIISNEDRLTQVLNIFLDNALKYTPAGGDVTLGCEEVPEGMRFFVADTGIGMDPDTQKLAFDRFHQAEKSHASKGSGLGLAIAKEIMEKMDIPILLESEKGKGSTFSFTVPRQHDI